MQKNFKWIGKSADGKTVTLQRFDGELSTPDYATEVWLNSNTDLIRTGVVLDTETTGFNKRNDVIIEIGIRSFLFNKNTGEILKLNESYSALQDPGFNISKEISMITGLTQFMLHEQKIDWNKVDAILEKADIIIAHNAAFDRPFLENKSKVSSQKVWACSVKQIDWTNKGFGSSKLELLSFYHGFFTDAHRALSDAEALLKLVSMNDSQTGLPYLNELLINARKPMVRVFAAQAPFESKDILKERGYNWDVANKVWLKNIFSENLNDEVAWMESAIYKGQFKGVTQEIAINQNFK